MYIHAPGGVDGDMWVDLSHLAENKVLLLVGLELNVGHFGHGHFGYGRFGHWPPN